MCSNLDVLRPGGNGDPDLNVSDRNATGEL